MKMRKPIIIAGLSVLCASMFTACGGGGGGGGDRNAEGGQVEAKPMPTHSSTLAMTADDTRLIVANRQNNSVSVLQVKDSHGNDTSLKLAEIAVGKEPRFVAVTPDGHLAMVTNGKDSTVTVIDLSDYSVKSTIDVGKEPRGIAFSPNGRYAYVANHTSGSVSVIRTSALAVVNTVTTGGNPMAIAITNDGDNDDLDETVHVTRFFSEVIPGKQDGFNDAKEGVVDYFTVAASLSSGVTSFHYKLAPIADSGFSADRRQYCQKTRDILEAEGDVVFFSSGPDGIPNTGDTAVAGDSGAASLKNEVFCPDINSSDALSNGPIAKVLQGAYTNYLYDALIRNNTLFIPNVGASPEPPVKFNLNVQALVSSVDLATGKDSTINLNAQIKTEAQPDETDETSVLTRLFGNDLVAMEADPSGKHFLVVSRGGNYVMRATLENGELSLNAPNVIRFKTGNLPTGVVMNKAATRAYTNNEVSTSVTAIDLQTNQVLAQDIDSSTPPVPGTQKHRNVTGKLAFFTALGIPDQLDTNSDGEFDIAIRDINPLENRNKASDNGWSSCSSCHQDGLTDNVTWIFPTGPRQTVSLEGTFANVEDPTTPILARDQRILNWNGVRGSVTDFNNNSRGVQGGKGHATDVDGLGRNRTGEVFNHGPVVGISDALDAMTEWVANSVDALDMPEDDLVAIASGRSLFVDNCAGCHGGDKWTKSSTSFYATNPTFVADPLGADFFAGTANILAEENKPILTVAGPQIVSVALEGGVLKFIETVGTLDAANPLEIRGAGAIAGQSTQGFGALSVAGGFNVPSLLGVAYHAPYLHDGSAKTLDEVFSVHQINGTAIDAAITGGDLENLKAFVLSIDQDTDTVNALSVD